MKLASFALLVACSSAVANAAFAQNAGESCREEDPKEVVCRDCEGVEPLHQQETVPAFNAQMQKQEKEEEEDEDSSYVEEKYLPKVAGMNAYEEYEEAWEKENKVEDKHRHHLAEIDAEEPRLGTVEKALGKRCPRKCLELGERYLEAKYRFEKCLKRHGHHHNHHHEHHHCHEKKRCEGGDVAMGKCRRGFASPFNTCGAQWGSCGPTTPFCEYRYIVANISPKLMGQINDNPNDDIMCRKPYFIEVMNVKNGKWIKAKIAGACYECCENSIQLSEKAYRLIGGHCGKQDRTLVKWRFAVHK